MHGLADVSSRKGCLKRTLQRHQSTVTVTSWYRCLCLSGFAYVCGSHSGAITEYILKMTWTHFSPAAVIRAHQPASAYRFVYVRGPQNIYNLLFNEVVVLQFTLKRFWSAFVVNKWRYVSMASFRFVNQTGQATGPWCV